MLGDLEGADRDLRAGFARVMRRLPARLGFADVQWEQVRALVEGRFADAEVHLRALEEWPGDQRVPAFTAVLGRAVLAFLEGDWAGERRGLGRAREIEPLAMAPYPDRPPPDRGASAAATAIRTFREEIDPLVPDWTRPVQCINLSETARTAGDAEVARALYREFSGLRGRWAVNTFAWCGGTYDRGLGVLAATAGDLDGAVDHLDRAVVMAESLGSPPHAVINRLELATALVTRDGPGDAARAATEIDTARRDAERVGMPGWIVLLDALAAGDREPWRLALPD